MIESLSDRDSFARLATGRRARCGPVRLRYVGPRVSTPAHKDSPGQACQRVRVAYAISRKSGTAVMRNRIRRRLRAALFELDRDHPRTFSPGDYLFTAGPELAALPFEEVRRMVQRAVAAVADLDGNPSSRAG